MSEHLRNELREGIRNILLYGYNKRIFSDCEVSWYGPSMCHSDSLRISCDEGKNKSEISVPDYALFDLASLTKPLVTLLCIITLLDRKIIHLNDSVELLMEQKVSREWRSVTLETILCHKSGLPAHVEYWRELIKEEKKDRKKSVINKILSEKRKNKGKNDIHVYSDLGYILLGFAIEIKTGKSLDDFWEEEIAKPLGIENLVNYPRKIRIEKRRYIKTGRCSWSGDVLEGIVHDDNCRALGGVCGHAGLFGTASGVLTLCQEMYFHLKKKKSRLPFSHDLFCHFCKRISNSEWTLGFNMPSETGSSSGSLFSSESLGHLGFTGTSFWIDPLNDLIVVLLTNRVFMGPDKSGIQGLRPAIHDFIAKNLIKKDRYDSQL